MKREMTFRSVVIDYDPDWDEYVVRAFGAPESEYYYTSDWDDAVATAKAMEGE